MVIGSSRLGDQREERSVDPGPQKSFIPRTIAGDDGFQAARVAADWGRPGSGGAGRSFMISVRERLSMLKSFQLIDGVVREDSAADAQPRQFVDPAIHDGFD